VLPDGKHSVDAKAYLFLIGLYEEQGELSSWGRRLNSRALSEMGLRRRTPQTPVQKEKTRRLALIESITEAYNRNLQKHFQTF
jgi:hypothetical protein